MARLSSPVFERNFEPIRDGLRPCLGAASGRVLEIGSGSGQHVVHLALAYPDFTWIPSEPDPAGLASIGSWRDHLGPGNVAEPLHLDAASDWADDPALAAHLPLTAVFSANVIHIAPWEVASGIVRGAGRVLARGGALIFYGPFKEGGRHTGEGNLRFDSDLRARNPKWGIRNVDDLAQLALAAGLGAAEVTGMPANNRLVAFKKS